MCFRFVFFFNNLCVIIIKQNKREKEKVHTDTYLRRYIKLRIIKIDFIILNKSFLLRKEAKIMHVDTTTKKEKCLISFC